MWLIRVNILEQSETCYILGLIDCTRGEENSITKGRFHTVRCLMGLPLLPPPLIKPGFLILNDWMFNIWYDIRVTSIIFQGLKSPLKDLTVQQSLPRLSWEPSDNKTLDDLELEVWLKAFNLCLDYLTVNQTGVSIDFFTLSYFIM